MTPHTVHLFAQVIRHSRGLATALGKWVEEQDDPVVALRDLREGVQMFRSMLTAFERQLEMVDVDYKKVRKVS